MAEAKKYLSALYANSPDEKKALDIDPRGDLIETLGNIEIYRVDGEEIRDSPGGEEFTNWGTHSDFDFIPSNEYWLDEDAAQDEDETQFYIEAAKVYEKYRQAGLDHDAALAKSNAKEQAMRDKYDGGSIGDGGVTHKPELETFETLDSGIVVKLVDGDWVRSHRYINFTEGGHSLVYPQFIPPDTIWLDNANEPQEQPYILFHEKHEYEDMAKGMLYPEAHKRASQAEYDMRSNLWEADPTNVERVGAKAIGGKDGHVDNQLLIWDDEIKAAGESGGTNGGFLVIEDGGQKHLPTKQGGKLSHRLMGAAWAALHSGYRGKKYSGPGKQAAIAKLKKLYAREKLPLPSEKAEPIEAVDDTVFDGDEISDLELAKIWEIPNIRAITDAPNLRLKDAQYCANCNFFKYLPPESTTAYTADGDQVYSYPMKGVCTQPEIQSCVDGGWVCDKFSPWQPDAEEVDEADTENKALTPYRVDTSFVKKLKPIQMVGETRAAGYGLYFSRDKRESDKVGTRFTKTTNLGHFYDKAPVLYHHGLVKAFGLDEIANTVKAQPDDIGVWLEIEIDRSKAYWKQVKNAIETGRYYFSGGSAEHLIDTAADGELRSFPIFEWSITTTPAEWRLGAARFYKAIGIDVDGQADSPADDKGKGDEESRQRQKRESQEREARNRSTEAQKSMEVDMTEEELAAKMAEIQANATKAALAEMKAESERTTKAAEEARKAEEAHQAELKEAREKAVAEYRASLPAEPTQRPGYGRYNVNRRPLGDGFSFSKAIRGIAHQTDGKPNPWSGAERELKVMQDHMNEMRTSLGEGVGDLGGYLVPPEYLQDQFIPLLRARAVVRMAGARTYPAKSDIVYIPSQTGGATAAWYGENATLSASNLTFGQLAINIRKLGALEYISNELLADSSPAADELVKEDLANVIALKEDATYLMSNGVAPTWANAPIGFASYTGTSSVSIAADVANGGNGGAIAVGDLFKFKLKLMQANVPFDTSMAWFMSPRTWDEVAQLKDSQNRYLLETLTGGNISQYPAYGAYPEGPETSIKGSVQGRLFGYPVYVTANITETNTWGNATTATYMFFARMNDVFIAERAGLELMASNVAGTAFASDQTWVRGIMREGLGIRHAPAVVVAGGLT